MNGGGGHASNAKQIFFLTNFSSGQLKTVFFLRNYNHYQNTSLLNLFLTHVFQLIQLNSPVNLELIDVSDMGSWLWEIDGVSTQIENAYDLLVLFSTGDQTQEQIIHLAETENQRLRWFTDCGDPLQQ